MRQSLVLIGPTPATVDVMARGGPALDPVLTHNFFLSLLLSSLELSDTKVYEP